MPVIKYGSKGKAVEVWQVILGIKVTGLFDINTENATKKFQAKCGLVEDGIVDSFTWSKGLGEL